MRLFSIALVVLISLHCDERCIGQTAYPMLMSIEPAATQIGGASEHTIKSRYSLQGAFEVLVSGTGVRGEVVAPTQSAGDEAAKDKVKASTTETLKVVFHADRDVLPGIREVRVVTPRGVSTIGQLVLTKDPVVYESSKNDTVEDALATKLPATLCGHIEKAEDVDYFRFQVEAGETLCFHVVCMRLQDRIHDLQQHADPILTIRDSNRAVVVMSDNVLQGDPMVCHTFEKGGDYWLELRDVRYQGNAYWEYCIEVNHRPFVTVTYPLGLSSGKTTPLELIGFGLAEDAKFPMTPKKVDTEAIQNLPVQVALDHSLAMPFVVTDLSIAFESDTDNQMFSAAQTIEVPCGVNGRLSKEEDVDCYGFEAKKGDRYSFEVFARRLGSSVDSQLRILDKNGNQLQLNDDLRLGKRNSSDSFVENWEVPADGRYTLEIRDLHLRGGPSYVYFINVTRSQPHFLLFADTDKTPISPGTSGVIFVRTERKNGFTGEIQLQVDGLPAGVKAHCGRILAGKGVDGCIILEAEAGAAPTASSVTISGLANIESEKDRSDPLRARALVYQEIYQPGGGRGHWPVESHVVAVTAPSDLRQVAVSSSEIRLKPGESQEIEVDIERAEGFDKNVTLDVSCTHLATIFGSSLPEGISVDTSASTTLLAGGATKGKLVFKAAKNSPPVEKQQIAVMANVSLNFVMKATYGSKPILLSVTE